MKKLLALMLCLTLVLSFTGCSLGGTKGTFSNLVAMSEIEEGGLSTHLTVKYDNENIMDSYTKFACIMEDGSLDDLEEFKEYYEYEIESYEEVFKNLPSKLSVEYVGAFTKENETFGDVIIELDKDKLTIPVQLKKDNVYIGIEGLIDTLFYAFDFMEEDLDGLDKEALKKALKEYTHIEFSMDDLELEDLEELKDLDYTPEQLKKISKPIDSLITTYLAPFIEKAEGNQKFTVEIGTLKSNILKVYELIDKNPGKFFDAVVDVVIEAQKAGIIESSDMDSIEDILGSLKDLKESRKEFINDWKELNLEEEINSMFEEIEETGIIELLEGSTFTFMVAKVGKTYGILSDIEIVVDGKSCITATLQNRVEKQKVPKKPSVKGIDLDKLEEVLMDNYEDLFDYDSDYDSDFDYDYDYPEEDDDDDEVRVQTITVPTVVADKNFTAMMKDAPNISGKTVTDFYNYYKTDFLNLSYSVIPELRKEQPVESIDKSYGSFAIYTSDNVSNAYTSANTYMYFSDGYLAAEFDTTLNGKNPEYEVETFAKNVESLFGYIIDDKTKREILNYMNDNKIEDEWKSFNFEVFGVEYSIGYYESESYDNTVRFSLGVEANYSY